MSMLSGSCLCGGVRYEIDGALDSVVFCHCSRCRKATGSAFAAVAPIAADAFRLSCGGGLLAEYESSPGVFRVFCRNCASPLYSRRPAQPDLLRLRIGTLDSDIGAPRFMHIFTGSKADWYAIHDEAPQFDTRP